jgi:ABC-type multidrug transport system ATPase subunit
MIKARQIEKRYGSFQAVHPMDLDVHDGEVFGFLGLNGAGKTTTLRMLGGVLPPTAGEVWIDGVSLRDNPVEARRRMGFIPDRPYLYDKLTAREFLNFLGDIYGVEPTRLARRVEEVLALQTLTERAVVEHHVVVRSFANAERLPHAIAASGLVSIDLNERVLLRREALCLVRTQSQHRALWNGSRHVSAHPTRVRRTSS